MSGQHIQYSKACFDREEWDSETEGSTDANTAPSKGGRVQSEEEATELS